MARTTFVAPADSMHDTRASYAAREDLPEVARCVVAGYLAGKPVSAVMAECGLSSTSVFYDILRAAGVELRRPKRNGHRVPDPVAVAQALAAYRGGEAEKPGLGQIKAGLGHRAYLVARALARGEAPQPRPETIILAGEIMASSGANPGRGRAVLGGMTPEEIAELQEAVMLIDAALPRRVRAHMLRARRGSLVGRGRGARERAARLPWVRALARALLAGVHPSPAFLAWILGVHPRQADHFLRNLLYPYARALAGVGEH